MQLKTLYKRLAKRSTLKMDSKTNLHQEKAKMQAIEIRTKRKFINTTQNKLI